MSKFLRNRQKTSKYFYTQRILIWHVKKYSPTCFTTIAAGNHSCLFSFHSLYTFTTPYGRVTVEKEYPIQFSSSIIQWMKWMEEMKKEQKGETKIKKVKRFFQWKIDFCQIIAFIRELNSSSVYLHIYLEVMNFSFIVHDVLQVPTNKLRLQADKKHEIVGRWMARSSQNWLWEQ